MKINIKTLSGVQHSINVEPHDKIEYIKKMVEEKVGIPPVQQRLVFSGSIFSNKINSNVGKILPDDKTVQELNIQPNQTIQLILQLKGGLQ